MSDGKIVKRDRPKEIERSSSSGSETIVKMGNIEGGVRYESWDDGWEVQAYVQDNNGNGVGTRVWKR